jgi:hypothetical protein
MIMGKKACRNKSNSWKVTQHACMQESMHKERNSWRKNRTRAWEEDLRSVGLVLSLKFRLHMVTRTQHRQTVMKSFMDLN